MIEIKKRNELNIKGNFLSGTINRLFRNKAYIIVLLIVFIKSILFTGVLGTNGETGIDIDNGFFSVPPYLVYLSFSMIILSISFLFKGRSHLWSLIIIDIFATILFIGDIWYYRGCSGFLNFFLISQSRDPDINPMAIISMFRPIDLIFIIDIPILIFYIIYNRELYRQVKRSIALFLATLFVPVIYMTYIHYKVDVLNRCFQGQTAFLQSWAPTQTMSNLGPLGYHIYDSYMYYTNSKLYKLSDQDKEDIKEWYDKNKEDLPDNQYAGMLKGKNLLVIQTESLENFVINQKIQGQEITPNLNRLLNNSLYFSNYHENVNNGVSSDSDLLTNTGVYPVIYGSTFFRYPNNTYKNSLPNVLENMGYSTLAIHPDKGSYWNWVPALSSIGFNECLDATSFESKNPIGLGLSDEELMSQVAPILEKKKQPFYTFMVTQTSHGPFDLPEQYRSLDLGNLDNNILGDYFQSIHYTDAAIGKFLDELDKEGVLKNTMVVIYGDHTGVHKFYQDQLDTVKPAEDWWQNNDMRIPLIIYNPSIQGKSFDVQGGQIDIMPTIEYLLGVDKKNYQNNALGKVLVNTNKNYTILQNLTMYGQYTAEDENHAKQGIILSDKMVQSNYFKGD